MKMEPKYTEVCDVERDQQMINHFRKQYRERKRTALGLRADAPLKIPAKPSHSHIISASNVISQQSYQQNKDSSGHLSREVL